MFRPEQQCSVYNHFTKESSAVFIFTDSSKAAIQSVSLLCDNQLIEIINMWKGKIQFQDVEKKPQTAADDFEH